MPAKEFVIGAVAPLSGTEAGRTETDRRRSRGVIGG